MNALVTERVRNLAGTLAELKVKVRTALATELASAVGTAVRDVLVVTIIDRMVATPHQATTRPPGSAGRRADENDDHWDAAKDPWSDDYEYRGHAPVRYDPDDEEPMPLLPTAAVVAAGVNVGRWWLAHNGTVGTAVGLGVLTTALGLTGGSVARAALAVLAASTDLLTAETALAQLHHS